MWVRKTVEATEWFLCTRPQSCKARTQCSVGLYHTLCVIRGHANGSTRVGKHQFHLPSVVFHSPWGACNRWQWSWSYRSCIFEFEWPQVHLWEGEEVLPQLRLSALMFFSPGMWCTLTGSCRWLVVSLKAFIRQEVGDAAWTPADSLWSYESWVVPAGVASALADIMGAELRQIIDFVKGRGRGDVMW